MTSKTQAGRVAARRAIVVAAVLAVVGTFFTSTAQEARALAAGDWKAGMIISDAKFFDGNAMSASEVQSFLSSKGANCVAGEMPCLKNYSMPTPAIPAESGLCSAVGATGGLTAAQIIDVVARSCGISQKVVLVTLQKEATLITKTRPSAINYRSATGFGCPDTAPCDAQYYGFFNQVYRMARQFKVYTNNPTRYGYQKGRNNNIQYNPNAGCGTSSVYIENQATANLYIYTPYQPNAAALNNMYGTGDSCSAYGNRNFWRMYTDWFGSTSDEAAINPQGAMAVTINDAGKISIDGWAFDMSNPYVPANVMLTNNGQQVGLLSANGPRPELANYGVPGNHGFTGSYQAPTAGNNEVCLFVFNIGGGSNILAQCVVVAQQIQPRGALAVSTSPTGVITADGWAFDLSEPATPANVMLTTDGGVTTILTANGKRPELAGYGIPGNHGFNYSYQGPTTGSSNVCQFVFNIAGGSDQLTACAKATVPALDPQGYFDGSIDGAGNINLSGYAFDLNQPGAPLNVMFTTNGQVTQIIGATGPRPELAYYGIPGNHGFTTGYKGPSGSSADVCMWAFNVGPGANTFVGCKTIKPPQINPQAAFAASASGKQINVNGWAFDLSSPASPVTLMITTNGEVTQFTSASGPRPELAMYGIPGNHGFAMSYAAPKAGTNQVCVYAFDIGGGENVLAGCQNVTAA